MTWNARGLPVSDGVYHAPVLVPGMFRALKHLPRVAQCVTILQGCDIQLTPVIIRVDVSNLIKRTTNRGGIVLLGA